MSWRMPCPAAKGLGAPKGLMLSKGPSPDARSAALTPMAQSWVHGQGTQFA